MRIFYESKFSTEPLLYLPSHPQEKLKCARLKMVKDLHHFRLYF